MELVTILSLVLFLAMSLCFEIALGKRIEISTKLQKFLFAWMPAICLSLCAIALVPYTYLCNPGTKIQSIWLNVVRWVIWSISSIGATLEIIRLLIFTKRRIK